MARRANLTEEPTTEAPPPPAAPSERESLAELVSEATGAATAGDDAAPIADDAAPQLAEPGLELIGGCVAVVSAIGGILCARAGVAPLSRDEADGLGRAVAGVAALYLPADAFDPVTTRWLALGGALLAVTLPRLSAPSAKGDTRPAVAPIRAAVAPDPGAPLPPGPIT